MRKPSFSRYSAASCSPCLPRTSLGCMRTTSGPDIAGGRRAGAAATAELWKSQAGTRAACGRGVLVVRCRWLDTQLTPWRTADASRCSRFFWQLKVALGQFLDVDILEGHDPDVLDEPGRPVHVPHPGVVHGDLEEHLAVVGGTDLEVDVVGEVEPALGLHHMGEEADDVAVLAIELELHLGLVLLEVLRAHVLPSAEAGARAGGSASALPCPGAAGGESAINSTIGLSPPSSTASTEPSARTTPPARSRFSAGTTKPPARLAPSILADTFTNERRCTGLAPQSSSAAM